MEKLGRYQIVGELGRGGCGVVYRAVDPSIGRHVAIKTIVTNPDEDPTSANDLLIRLRREAQSAGVLSHPNIVTVHELAEEGNLTYIVMEHVSGENLKQTMAREKTLPDDRIVALMRQAADALDYAHSQGVVHRDVKPANFMLSERGPLKIADFGIAKILSGETSGITQTGMMIGTMHYMAPEQIALKPVDGRTDQFALGVIAYELLTGQKPFQGDSAASIIHQVMNGEPPPVEKYRTSLGGEATKVLRRALAKEPSQRYRTCGEFVNDLEAALKNPERVTATMQSPAAVQGAPKKSRALVWIFAALAMVVVALQGYRTLRSGDAPPAGTASDASPVPPAPTVPPAPASEAAPPPTAPPPISPPSPDPIPSPKQGAQPGKATPAKREPDRAAESKRDAASPRQPEVARDIPAAPPPEPPSVEDPERPSGGRYRGPPDGSFRWSGTLAAKRRLVLAGNRANAGSVSGRGLPFGVAVSVEVTPREARVIELPTASNRYRLVLANAGDEEISTITVRWKERRD